MSELPAKKYLRPDEVAAFWSVSTSTVYRWVGMGILDAVRPGGKLIRINRESLERLGEPGEK